MPSGEVCRIEIDPINGRAEIKYSQRIYSVSNGEWVGGAPTADRLRQIKHALSNALPKPKSKPKSKPKA